LGVNLTDVRLGKMIAMPMLGMADLGAMPGAAH